MREAKKYKEIIDLYYGETGMEGNSLKSNILSMVYQLTKTEDSANSSFSCILL
jgi:hypothetical protein